MERNFSIKSEKHEKMVNRARSVWEKTFWDALGCGESEAAATTLANRASERAMAAR